MTMTKGAKQLVVQKALLTILSELSYLLWFKMYHKHGAIRERGRDDYLFGPTLPMGLSLLYGDERPVTSITYLASASPTFDFGKI